MTSLQRAAKLRSNFFYQPEYINPFGAGNLKKSSGLLILTNFMFSEQKLKITTGHFQFQVLSEVK